jgi:hypothetical protein
MIPFFRKLRKQLADDNKPLKYLRYAIGEIVLVVIGILIALSKNNWNQDQQNKKLEQATLKSLLTEFQDNKTSIRDYLENVKSMRKFGDTLRKLLGPEITSMSQDYVHRLIGEIGTTTKCVVSIDALGDIQSSGKLNLLSNVDVRKGISKWSSILKELQAEEFDWAQEYSSQFMPYTNKWMQWDNVDYVFEYRDSIRYFKSRFDQDPRRMLQQPEFANIMSIQYWRIVRIERRTDVLLKQTDSLVGSIKNELETFD